MMERLGLDGHLALEGALRALGASLDFPPTPDLAASVGARLAARPTPIGRRRSGLVWEVSVLRSVRRSLLLAAVIALLATGATLGVRLGLDLLRIEFGPLPTAAPSGLRPNVPTHSSGIGPWLELGTAATLDEAQAAADHPLLVPTDPGPPDEVYLGREAIGGQIAFLYRAGPLLPASPLLGGAGLLITQAHGTTDSRLAGKLVNAEGAVVEPVSVGGADGYWFAGPPHVFWYLGPDGVDIVESRRQVGNTLVWERNGILYRIEGSMSKERAMEIAASMY